MYSQTHHRCSTLTMTLTKMTVLWWVKSPHKQQKERCGNSFQANTRMYLYVWNIVSNKTTVRRVSLNSNVLRAFGWLAAVPAHHSLYLTSRMYRLPFNRQEKAISDREFSRRSPQPTRFITIRVTARRERECRTPFAYCCRVSKVTVRARTSHGSFQPQTLLVCPRGRWVGLGDEG